jgi:hypothetical protein
MTKIAGSGSESRSGSESGPLVRDMDPRIRIHTKMSWIRNTAYRSTLHAHLHTAQGEQLAKSSPEVINRLIPVGVECFLIQVTSYPKGNRSWEEALLGFGNKS